jgi:hypothetical protein
VPKASDDLPEPDHAAEDDERVARDIDADVLQVVFARTAHMHVSVIRAKQTFRFALLMRVVLPFSSHP